MESVIMRVYPILLVLLASLAGGIGQILFKMASAAQSRIVLGWVLEPKGLAAIAAYLVAAVLFLSALRHERVSILYPILAASYLWVSLLSFWVLKEKILFLTWVGLAMILLGVVLIGYSAS
jgi:undecaprenyl phosphate-alpha-L-ara4N flippase subunit ArnE